MSRLAAALAVIVAVILLAQPARGQTPPPPPGGSVPVTSPTPSPTALPDARTLLQQTTAADAAKHSAHMTISGTITMSSDVPGVSLSGTVSGKGDQNFVTNAYRETMLTRIHAMAAGKHKTFKERESIVSAKGHLAVRINHKRFRCTKVAGGSATGAIPTIPNDPSITVTNQGLVTVDGVSAWDVRVAVALPGGSGQTLGTLTLDVYINAADNTTVEETLNLPVSETFKVKKHKHTLTVTETIAVTFSRYGETLHFKLPKACKAKAKKAALAQVPASASVFGAAQVLSAAGTR